LLVYIIVTELYRSADKSLARPGTKQATATEDFDFHLRFPDFMTAAQNGGKVVSLTHRPPLSSGNTPGTHFC